MKKIILFIILLISHSVGSYSQQVAANFTAMDCNSNNHTLHNDLDNGKVVILIWVMPCGTCINPAKSAYQVAKSYDSNPNYQGKIIIYLMDDDGIQDCSYLSNWAGNNNIGPDMLTVLQNTNGTVIKENDFGGTGMPHIVIAGGTDHKIYYNEKDGANIAGIGPALFNALTPASVKNVRSSNFKASVYPNPASNKVSVDYILSAKSEVSVDIVNVIGAKLYSSKRQAKAGMNSDDIRIDNLQGGVYFIKLNTNGVSETLKFTVTK